MNRKKYCINALNVNLKIKLYERDMVIVHFFFFFFFFLDDSRQNSLEGWEDEEDRRLSLGG